MSGQYGGMYSGSYLKAADLQREYTPCVITSVAPEEVSQGEGKGTKKLLVLGFHGTDTKLILNATNYHSLCEILGDNEPAWVGHAIQLWKTKTQFGARMVDCIRVVPAQQQAPPPHAAPPAPALPPQQPPQQAPMPQAPPPAAPPQQPPVASEEGFGAQPSPPIEAYDGFNPEAEDDEILF